MKKIKHKFITCASFGGTGSSAITDLMKEFSNILSLGDYEFTFAHEVDGISELQHYIMDDWHRLKADEGLFRYMKMCNRISKDYNRYFNNKFTSYTDEYIESLIYLTWQGYWPQQRYRIENYREFFEYRLPLKIQRILIKLIKKNSKYELVPKQKRQKLNYISKNNDFFNLTKLYTSKLLSSVDEDYKYEYLAFDQLVPPFNINRYINYFDNLKVIIVDRDPRDLYILNKKYWNEGWIPTENVDIYIKWFKDMREKISLELTNESVLFVKFENLIYNYEEEVSRIIKFIGIDKSKHFKRLEFFNPESSIKNTRLWIENNEYYNDIKKIEVELKNFCYLL